MKFFRKKMTKSDAQYEYLSVSNTRYHFKFREVAEKDFYLSLLFYHLKLRYYVVIESKGEVFKQEYAGKLNCRWVTCPGTGMASNH